MTFRNRALTCASLIAMLTQVAAPTTMAATPAANDRSTATPIKHVIVIIGENRTFDHLFATYVPPHGSARNLLSEGIITPDGSAGANVGAAKQFTASVRGPYTISPPPAYKVAYKTLPPPNTGYVSPAPSTTAPPFPSVAFAAAVDYGLDAADLGLLTIGASGLPYLSVDTRIAHVSSLPNQPIQLTPSLPYTSYVNSPVHRFYQMWEEMDCAVQYATRANPSGCKADLFPWVETTIGAGNNGATKPADFTNETTGEGSTSFEFYNVQHGDVPYFKSLADQYALADNYHQPIMGGTGANSVVLGYADALWYSDGNGHALTPPTEQIENPNPQAGTNNWYTQDGYSGGTYSNCSDWSQPGVAAVTRYLQALPYHPSPNCRQGHYYLLNNYNPGYNGDGTVNTSSPFTLPPSTTRSIADSLRAAKVSWTYYGEEWNNFVKDPSSPLGSLYCNICNPFLYQKAVMTDPALRTNNLKDTTDFYADVKNGTLPAVSWVKPSGLNDGHPESSKFDIFEAFTKKILNELQANPKLWAETAVFVTTDEGGGYYDSGYVQPLDFFGDGTRIPLLVVSPYSKGVGVVHTYSDHASFIKFVDANWRLRPITDRSRDNLPNPVSAASDPYVPTNKPAIGDLMDFFSFPTP